MKNIIADVTCACNIECFFDNARDVIDIRHQVVVFRNLTRNLNNRRLLKSIRSDESPWNLDSQLLNCTPPCAHLSCDGHDWNTVEQCISQSSYQIRRPWEQNTPITRKPSTSLTRSRCGNADTHSACHFGISLSSKDLSLSQTPPLTHICL